MTILNRVIESKWLILICLLFLLTRLYKINDIPASLYWDEVSIGYNAYSVLKTGQDEWGDFLPLHFRAFGEFKLPVYIYSVVPFIAFFGLSEIAIRLPAVLFSLGIVILTYVLSLQFFKDKKVALGAIFLLTISPWFFIFSRTGYEMTAGLFFFMLGLFFYFKFSAKLLYIFLGTFSWLLSLYSYNSFRIIIPILIPLLIFIYLIKGKNLNRRSLLLVLIFPVILIISFIPILRVNLSDTALLRANQISFLKQASNSSQILPTFLSNYFSHLSPNFLLFEGDQNLRSQQSNFGQLYFLDLLIFLIGLVVIFRNRENSKWLLIILILISLVPASLTKEAPHALRSLTLIPFFYMVASLGLVFLLKKLNSKTLGLAVIATYLGLFSYYYFQFLTSFPNLSSGQWQYGYKKIFTDYANDFSKYKNILVSNQLAQPYIFYLFYQKIDPLIFRQSVEYAPVADWGFSTVAKIANLNFIKLDQKTLPEGKTLIFITPQEKIKEDPTIRKLGEIRNLNGQVSFYVYEK